MISIRAMNKDEQAAFAAGSNDFRQHLDSDPARHHYRTQEEKDAYTRGFQMAIGESEAIG